MLFTLEIYYFMLERIEIKKLVKQTMEEAIQLSVPLIADENEGVTWYEAK